MSDCIRVERLVVARGGKDVIHGIDLQIPTGQITALLGANGAGKSSLVLAIAGALPASYGTIYVDGKSIAGMRPENIRRLGVAAVPEGHHVLSDLSVIDNLRVAGHHLPGRRREDGVEAALTTFPELRQKLDARAGSLSGGSSRCWCSPRRSSRSRAMFSPTSSRSVSRPSSSRGSCRSSNSSPPTASACC